MRMKDEKREDTDMTDDLLQHPEKRRSDGRKELMGLTEVMGFLLPRSTLSSLPWERRRVPTFGGE